MSPPNHDGTAARDEGRFADAPAAIGAVRSTTSNVVDGRVRHPDQGAMGPAMLQAMRFFGMMLGVGFLLGFGVLVALEALEVELVPELLFVGGGLGALVGLGVPALRVLRPPRQQTFVGEEGIARVRGGSVELARFEDVARTEEIGGRLDGADFFGVVFYSADGARLFHVGGVRPNGRAPVHHATHFADAARAALAAHRARRP